MPMSICVCPHSMVGVDVKEKVLVSVYPTVSMKASLRFVRAAIMLLRQYRR